MNRFIRFALVASAVLCAPWGIADPQYPIASAARDERKLLVRRVNEMIRASRCPRQLDAGKILRVVREMC
jgi:hypothetical protein